MRRFFVRMQRATSVVRALSRVSSNLLQIRKLAQLIAVALPAALCLPAATAVAQTSPLANYFLGDVSGASSEETLIKFEWGNRKKYPEYGSDRLQFCWHNQAVDRLPDRDGKAYFVFVSSNKEGGMIHVAETSAGFAKMDGRIESRDGSDGKIIWHWSMQKDDSGDTLPGTNTKVGRWNHPAKADTLGELLVVAMQDVNLTEGKYSCGGTTGQDDAIVWLDFTNRGQPVHKATWHGPDFGLKANADCMRVAALAVPDRTDNSKSIKLISISGQDGNAFGVSKGPGNAWDATNYKWFASPEGPPKTVGRISEWYYGKWDANGDNRVIQVTAIDSHSFKIAPLLFLDQGETADQAWQNKKFLPSASTVNFSIDKKAGEQTYPTYVANEPTPRASGIFVSATGAGFILCGEVNDNKHAKVWLRQPKKK